MWWELSQENLEGNMKVILDQRVVYDTKLFLVDTEGKYTTTRLGDIKSVVKIIYISAL